MAQMPLSPGTRIGPYEIDALLGAGGMGEVYRGRDTNLNRSVALKILPESFAADADRVARFKREAQVLASLDHPNIAAIYGIEQLSTGSGQLPALVMELVDGEDLSVVLARGAMVLDQAIAIAKQLAEGLEAAHERGIVHRDLKPQNIKVRADGTVKILDFGLAKAIDPDAASAAANAVNSPTRTSPAMTAMGVILGTAAYMSPEQAKGRAVDRRADIWAFGVVLYEMLAGQRLFAAEDISETLAAVLTREVNVSSLPAAIPPRLRALVRDCLVRDPKQRLRDIGDARLALDKIIAGAPDDAITATGALSADRRSLALAWTAAGVLAVAFGIMVWAPWRVEKPLDRMPARLDVDLGADLAFPSARNTAGSNIAISPDGTRLAYTSGAPTRLFTRVLDQPNASELQGARGARLPFFSADGHWIGFMVGNKLDKISVDGGGVVVLGEVDNFAGASWAEDDRLFVSDSRGRGLVEFPKGGGTPQVVAPRGNGESLTAPQLLPSQNAILFAACAGDEDFSCNVEVLTLGDGRRKVVAHGGRSPHYVSSSNGAGYLIYTNGATLSAVPFDLSTLETRGTAVPVLNDVGYAVLTRASFLDVSNTGTLIYRTSRADTSLATLQWVDADGKQKPLNAKPEAYGGLPPAFSPDGKRIATTIFNGPNEDVWVYDTEGQNSRPLTHGGFNISPVWSPDGQFIVFDRPAEGMFQARADFASPPEVLMPSKIPQLPYSFTPDGKRLAYFQPTAVAQIWTVPLENQGGQLKAGSPERFLKSSSQDTRPAFSPDGRRLAYVSNKTGEDGKDEVYVRAFPPSSSGQGGEKMVSNNRGAGAVQWSRTGHELVYRSGNQLMSVPYSINGDDYVYGKPEVWISQLRGGTAWALDPTSKRVAVVVPEATAEASLQEHEIVMFYNFGDELRRRVPIR